MRNAVTGYLLAASVFWLAQPSAVAEEPEACSLTLEVRNCSGGAIAEVEVEIESGDTWLGAVTDEEGRAAFEVCRDEVGEVRVFLIEGGAPVRASPSFEDDTDEGEAVARVFIC